jgi:hypothetical protein
MAMKLILGVTSRGPHKQIGQTCLALVRNRRIPGVYLPWCFLKAACAIVGMLIILTISLAGPLHAAQDETKALRERATTLWEARVKGDWGTVYDYLSESKEIGTATKQQYIDFSKEKGPFVYVSYKVGEVEVDEDTGWVKTAFALRPLRFPEYPPNRVEQWQLWEKRDGKWYPIPKERMADEPKLPPSLRPLKEERAVTARADGFWQAREKSDYGSLYQYLPPSFREKVSKEEFLGKSALNVYVDHQVHWAEVEGDRANVRVTVGSRPNDPNLTKMDPNYETILQEWIKVKDQWYLDVSS